jgi:DNA-binding response OmpR family regulator
VGAETNAHHEQPHHHRFELPRPIDRRGGQVQRKRTFRWRILVVDNDRDFRDLYATALRGAGYEVETSPDGEAALMKLAFRHFDLAIVDWHMPRLDGASLVFWLRSAGSTTPVVMVTGSDTSTLPQSTMRELAAILPKPISLTEYLGVVRAALFAESTNGHLNRQVA